MNSKTAKKKNFFIKPLGFFVFIGLIVALSIFGINFFFNKPSAKSFIQSKEKSKTTLFLENLMIREGGLYTLMGTKPITEFDIDGTLEESEEDIRKSYEEMKAFLERAESEKNKPDKERTAFNPSNLSVPTYEDYKIKCEKNRGFLKFLNHKKLWLNFRERHKNLDPKFMLFSRKFSGEENNIALFVNIPNLVYVLHHHYEDFSKRTQTNFDPKEIVFQISNESSVFWNKVFTDHFLKGLVYGYGERSAYLFEWSDEHLETVFKERRAFFSNKDRLKEVANFLVKSNIQVSDLPIPEFFHFGITDSKKIEYEIEKERIVKSFEDKDFTSEVMKILNGEE